MTLPPSNKRASHKARGDDLYETPVVAVRALLSVEPLPHRIWEPACGPGNIVAELRAAEREVIATDLTYHACPGQLAGVNFLKQRQAPLGIDTIVTNPPFKHAHEFVSKALELCPRVIMLLRLAFLESERRRDILDGGRLARVHVFRKRLPMMHRAGWTGPKATSAVAFAWFVWEASSESTTLSRLSWEPFTPKETPP